MKIKLSMNGLNKINWIKQLRTDVGYHSSSDGESCYIGLRDAKGIADILWELFEEGGNTQSIFLIDTEDYPYIVPAVELVLSHTESSTIVSRLNKEIHFLTTNDFPVNELLKRAAQILIDSEDYSNAIRILDVLEELK